jgi:hypothetical protein
VIRFLPRKEMTRDALARIARAREALGTRKESSMTRDEADSGGLPTPLPTPVTASLARLARLAQARETFTTYLAFVLSVAGKRESLTLKQVEELTQPLKALLDEYLHELFQ